jgi:hypothetical protein
LADHDDMQHGRRTFLAAVSVAAASAGVPATIAAAQDVPGARRAERPAREAASAIHDDRPLPLDERTRAVLGPLAIGASVSGFALVAAHAPFLGAIPLVFERDGARVQIDVMRRGDGPAPMAETAALALYAHESDAVARATLGALTRAVADVLRAHDHHADTLGLACFDERSARHPWGVFSV